MGFNRYTCMYITQFNGDLFKLSKGLGSFFVAASGYAPLMWQDMAR